MNTIVNIVDAAREAGMAPSNLLVLLSEWIGNKEEILSFQIDKKNDRVLVLTCSSEKGNKQRDDEPAT